MWKSWKTPSQCLISGTHLEFRKEKGVVKSTNEVLLLTSTPECCSTEEQDLLEYWVQTMISVWCCASFWGCLYILEEIRESHVLLIHWPSNLLILKWWAWSDHQVDDLRVYRCVENFLVFTWEEHRAFWIVHLALRGTGRKIAIANETTSQMRSCCLLKFAFAWLLLVEQGKVCPGKHW